MGVLGVLAVTYVLVRERLLHAHPTLAILEFPIGLAVTMGLLILSLRPAAPPAEPSPWRRHTQVVRRLPDPELAPFARVIERYLETGEGAAEAAKVLAAASRPPGHADDPSSRLAELLAKARSRKHRETTIMNILDQEV